MQIAVVPKYKEYALRSAIRSYSAAAVVKERKSTKTVPPSHFGIRRLDRVTCAASDFHAGAFLSGHEEIFA